MLRLFGNLVVAICRQGNLLPCFYF